MEERLRQAMAAGTVPAGLVVTFSSAHGLWGGGTTITVAGDGAVRRVFHARARSGEADRVVERRASPAEIRALLELLVAAAFWALPLPGRMGIPDEGRIAITVACEGASVGKWRWQRNVPPDPAPPDPFGQVATRLHELAPGE